MKRTAIMLSALLLFWNLFPAALAHEVPDLDRIGSVTFSMVDNGEGLDGGSLSMYRVGDIAEENGNYYFTLIPELADTGISLEDMADRSLSDQLAQAAQTAQLVPLSAQVADGAAAFGEVPNGLYVVVQTPEDACDGYQPISPFLISMPLYKDNGYVYEISCKPKVALVPESTESTGGSASDTPSTGDRQLPIPALLVSGAALFVLGWYPTYKRRKENNEKEN